MNQFSWKGFSLLLVVMFAFAIGGCSKKVAAPPPPPPPSAPPPAPVTPAPTITLSSNTATITAGQSATLSYTSTNATSVTIQPGIGAVQPATSGTRQVNPAATTTFTATATGPGGTATSAAVNIAVNTPPPVAPPARPVPPPVPVTSNRSAEEVFRDTMQPILFDYDKSTIRPGEESKLLAEAAYLKQNPAVRFTVEGYADERGSQEYNVALGDERAAVVRKYLASQGVSDSRMNSISYGEERPICRDQTEECWQKNRRAAFKMS